MKKSDFDPVPVASLEKNAGLISKRGFISQANYQGPSGEKFTLPSLTVPDMTISLREMLNRHLHGGSIKTFQTTNVRPDSIIPDNFERMSAIDRAALSQDLADFVSTTRGKMITAKEAKRRAEFQKLVDDAAAAKVIALGTHSSE